MASQGVVSSSQRRACWAARDAYQDCMMKNADNEDGCKSLKEEFVKACPEAWVKHFEKQRVYLNYKRKLLEDGFKPAEDEPSS
eukprot:m.12414 g.12414  ORF g.12414 m.12414 type:complete len:83 (+) comp9944_c0_seq1:53-301(+)